MDRLKKRDRLWYTENMNWDEMVEEVERLKDENAQLRMNIEILENIADCYKQMAEKNRIFIDKIK